MFKRFGTWIRETFIPLAEIAKQLRIMNEMKEAELSERRVMPGSVAAPIYRITEKPSARDTEVSYAGMDDKKRPTVDLLEEWERESEDTEQVP